MRCASSVVILAFLVGFPAQGAGPKRFRIEEPRGFVDGRLLDVALDDRGVLTLAPATRRLWDTKTPAVYSLAVARDGAVFAGTGNEGQVVRIDEKGAAVIFDAEEPLVTALAVGPDGRTYVGTSPNGKVYAVDAKGHATTVLEPAATYIWGLEFGGDGRLLVATGAPARVLERSPNGKTRELFVASETHIQSLAVGRNGVVFAGSSPGGIVYRIDADGRAFALLDSPYEEVKALALRPDGTLYVLVSNGKAEAAPATQPAAADATVKAEVTVTESFAVPTGAKTTAPAATTTDAAPADATAGALFRIRADGSREALWGSKDEAPFALALSPDGCLVASGTRARLHRVNDDGSDVVFGPLAADHIVALAPTPAGFVAGSANPGGIFAIDAQMASRGSYESPVRDAGSHSRWGHVDVLAETVPGTRVLVSTRSGNTGTPDLTWADWSAPKSAEHGFPIASPAARFLQVKLELEGTAKVAPCVHSLSAAYLPANRRPRVTDVLVHPAGEVLQKPPATSDAFDVLGLPPQAPAKTAGQPIETPSPASYARKSQIHGLRTFSWKAEDPDDDPLIYAVSCRRLGESRPRLLRTDLTEAVLAWDTRTLPDGRYVLSVEASDTPANPATFALEGRRASLPFDIDNTAPKLEAAVVAGPGPRIRARVTDEASTVERLEYSLDGATWQEVYPEDGIADARSEAYDFVVAADGRAAARQTIAIRAFDSLGNASMAHVSLP